MKRKKLKLWRVANDMTQEQLATALGVTTAYVNQIERGKIKPSYGFLRKFEEIFKVENVMELFKEGE